MGKKKKRNASKVRTLGVKQSLGYVSAERAMEEHKTDDFTTPEVIAQMDAKYPHAFPSENAKQTLFSSRMIGGKNNGTPQTAEWTGKSRTCNVTGERRKTIRLLPIPENRRLASEMEFIKLRPRQTVRKTGRKRKPGTLPVPAAAFWKRPEADLSKIVKFASPHAKKALCALIHCLDEGTAATSEAVGSKFAKMFGHKESSARKRLSDLEATYHAVHTHFDVSLKLNVWRLGPRNGEELIEEPVVKKHQSNRLEARYAALMSILPQRFWGNEDLQALILNTTVTQLRKHSHLLTGCRWRDTIGRRLTEEEDSALAKTAKKLKL